VPTPKPVVAATPAPSALSPKEIASLPESRVWEERKKAYYYQKGAIESYFPGLEALTDKERELYDAFSPIPGQSVRLVAAGRYDKELRKRLVALNPKWSKEAGKAVIDGEVFLGMSAAQAKASWGEPKDVNQTLGSWGTHEQWVYEEENYLYLENGKLTSIQR
jgi:hypothetical protein